MSLVIQDPRRSKCASSMTRMGVSFERLALSIIWKEPVFSVFRLFRGVERRLKRKRLEVLTWVKWTWTGRNWLGRIDEGRG